VNFLDPAQQKKVTHSKKWMVKNRKKMQGWPRGCGQKSNRQRRRKCAGTGSKQEKEMTARADLSISSKKAIVGKVILAGNPN